LTVDDRVMTAAPIRLHGHASLALLGLIGGAAVMTVTFVTATAEPARAATAYRYWAYYVAHRSSWQYATRGPATEYPVDGEVQGWRFAVQIDSGNGREPRATPTFATLCASTPPKAGDIRVGVVLDFGLAADAPAHDHPPATVVPGCVSVPSGSTGAQVLLAAASVRLGTGSYAGLVCGVDGYPTTECAVAVTVPSHPTGSPAPSPRATPTQRTTPKPAADPVISALAAAPTSGAPQSPATSATERASASQLQSMSASASSLPRAGSALGALRTVEHHRFPVLAAVGAALVVVLGAGAVWRSRGGRP
jgi:hypothetical protein